MIDNKIFLHYYALIFKFFIVKICFSKFKYPLQPTFYNVTFDSSMCQVYSTKEKIDFSFSEALEYTMIFIL
jgi:hypothetical protein